MEAIKPYGIVHPMALRCYWKLNPWARIKYSVEDLRQEGILVLYEIAIPRFDASLGIPFRLWFMGCLLSRYSNIVKQENHYSWLREDCLDGNKEPPEPNFSSDEGLYDFNTYSRVYKSREASNNITPEDDMLVTEAIGALSEISPVFVEFVVGSSPRAVRYRRKVVTSALRSNKRNNKRKHIKRKRRQVTVNSNAVADFFGLENLSELRKIFYNYVMG